MLGYHDPCPQNSPRTKLEKSKFQYHRQVEALRNIDDKANKKQTWHLTGNGVEGGAIALEMRGIRTFGVPCARSSNQKN